MTKTKIALAASLGLALASPALATGTADGTTTGAQEQEQVRDRVHRTLTHQGEVSEQDASGMDPEVSEHAKHAGYGPAISQAIHDALAQGCKGQCLVEKIHAVNHAIDGGASPASAAAGTTSKGTTSKGARASSADAQARSMDHRRDAARREAAADRVHDRTMDHGQAGAHAMGGGMGHR